MTLVLFHPEKNEISLYEPALFGSAVWRGSPYIVWKSIEIAMGYGWEVIGEL